MKKFLALVLALVMTMSLVTISAGAEFTDADEVTYAEAVDVMTAVGVVGGYADGSFNPTAGLTRGAAAKIICNMILGPTTAEALTANEAPFSDVAVDNVFAGYIAYCVNEGIISGYADGTFKPAAPLTGYAFMKMLLGALGYDATNEGYVGTNWSIQVAKRALAIGLDDGLTGSFVGNKALTREEAALYAYNTLMATMVDYENDSKITVGDIVISNSSKAEEVGQGDYDKLYGCNDKTLQFAEKYFSDLSGKKSTDAFGRPAVEWKVDKTVVGTYAGEADYVVVLDETYANLTALVADVLDETDEDLNADAAIAGGDTWFNGAALANKTAVETKLGTEAHAGTVIELFVADDDVTVTDIVAYGYELAEIESVSEKVPATAAKKGATTSIKLKGISTYYDEFEDAPAKVLAGFDAETYTKGTMIAIVKGDNGIIDSYVAETVEGKVSSFKKDVHAYVDGTKYLAAGGVEIRGIDFEEEYTLYLDANSFVLKVAGDTATAISDVYYVNGVYSSTTSKGATTYYAEVVALTGEASDVVISKATFDALKDDGVDFDTVGALYALDQNKDDEYEIPENKKANTFDASDANDDYDVVTGKLTEDVKASAKSLNNSAKSYLNDETQYVSIKLKAAKDVVKEVKTAVGGMSMVKNIDTITITEDGEKDALYVIYVGADVSATVDTGDVVFVSVESEEGNGTDTWLTDLWFMDTVTEDTVTVEAVAGEKVGFYTYAINEDGNYELKDLAAKTGKVDEDWSGWTTVMFKKAGIHNNTLSYKNVGGTTELVDVDFSAATVIDLRDEDAVDAGSYNYDYTITSVSDLVDSAEENATRAYVYVEDGVITFVAVTHEYN